MNEETINDVIICNPDLSFDEKCQHLRISLLKRGIGFHVMTAPTDLIMSHGYQFMVEAKTAYFETIYPDKEFFDTLEEEQAVDVSIYQIQEDVDMDGYGKWKIRFAAVTKDMILLFEQSDEVLRWVNGEKGIKQNG